MQIGHEFRVFIPLEALMCKKKLPNKCFNIFLSQFLFYFSRNNLNGQCTCICSHQTFDLHLKLGHWLARSVAVLLLPDLLLALDHAIADKFAVKFFEWKNRTRAVTMSWDNLGEENSELKVAKQRNVEMSIPDITIIPAITEVNRIKNCTKLSRSCLTITFSAETSYLKYNPGIPWDPLPWSKNETIFNSE